MSLGALSTYHINIRTSNPFALAFNAAGGASVRSSAALTKGIYYLSASQPAIVRAVPSNGDAAALPATQDGTAKGAMHLPAGVLAAVSMDGNEYLAVLGSTASAGTLYIVGPIGRSPVR